MSPYPMLKSVGRYDTSYVSKIPMFYDGKNLQDVQRSRENLIHYMGVTERTFESPRLQGY